MPTRNHKRPPANGLHSEPQRFDSASLSATTMEEPKECTMAERVEQATEAVGAGMESLGQTIREHEPQSGVLHTAGDAVAEKLEAGGRYLEEKGLEGIGEDLTNMIRQNPVPALLIGVGVGLLLARMMRS